MTPRPIEIIGGGLAGLSLGVALRRAGVPVVLHEAGDYPRHRVCGEFITGLDPQTIDRLHLANLLAPALCHHEVAWHLRRGAPVQVHRLPAPALALSRYTLDAELAARFVATGGELHVRSRRRVADDAPGRVFATGRQRAQNPRWLGLKVHARGLTLARDLEMHLGAECYVGLTRVAPDVVNVCGLFRLRPLRKTGPELLLAYLEAAQLRGLAERLAGATLLPESFSAVAALDFDRRWRRDTRLCVGDAGAMIPPFTGNGMAIAFQSAALALPPLIAFARGEATWAETCCATHRAQRGRFRVRLASARALHPFLLSRRRQQWFATLSRARLLPFRSVYAALH